MTTRLGRHFSIRVLGSRQALGPDEYSVHIDDVPFDAIEGACFTDRVNGVAHHYVRNPNRWACGSGRSRLLGGQAGASRDSKPASL